MAALSVLFIGGTGIISSACVRRAVGAGHEVTVLNRGGPGRGGAAIRPLPDGVRSIVADAHDPAALAGAVGREEFDVVADFVAFTPDQAQTDIDVFTGRVGQYVFISSASAYQTPPAHLPITEATPLANPYWTYSRDKIAAELLLGAAYRDGGFPATIVRPSHTYDRTSVPTTGGWTDIVRMRAGQPVLVHGDGSSIWVLTHHDDFAQAFTGLLGRRAAVGASVHITSDELLSWDAIYRTLADAAGVSDPQLVHVSSDRIAAEVPEWGPGLLGDKTHSVVFDNSLVKSLVPGWVATTAFATGAREIVAWHDADPGRGGPDPEVQHQMDELLGLSPR
jgi:nucleoside-diphosphate-sugar epimerase